LENAYFEDLKTKIKKNPLLGSKAHAKMMPLSRKEELEALDFNSLSPRFAAVLCLIYPKNGELYFPLILRNTYPGVHSNQVSFPGGRIENTDVNFEHTALRECEEEIGVLQEKVKVLRQLSDIYIPPSNFQVKSFIGFSKETPEFQLQPDEVEQLIEVKLSELLDDSILITEYMTTSYADKMEVKAFKLNNFTVWGATAMILSEIKYLLKSH
jgi:8-oxo-dGTP pyrophosphatase MutT (NUDIX family)